MSFDPYRLLQIHLDPKGTDDLQTKTKRALKVGQYLLEQQRTHTHAFALECCHRRAFGQSGGISLLHSSYAVPPHDEVIGEPVSNLGTVSLRLLHPGGSHTGLRTGPVPLFRVSMTRPTVKIDSVRFSLVTNAAVMKEAAQSGTLQGY